MKQIMALIALAVGSFFLFSASADGKTITGTKFITVYKGKGEVICRLDYSVQYGSTGILCQNRTHIVYLLGSIPADDLGPIDGSIAMPTEATPLYVGDYWRRGQFVCVGKTYGRVRCESLKYPYHWFVMGATFVNRH